MHDVYENPLTTRYASRAMQQLFSQDTRTITWRKLWVALAESEMELGLPVTQAQVDELQGAYNRHRLRRSGAQGARDTP